MDLEGLHVKYQELDKNNVLKEGDTTSFASVKKEILSIYNWEQDFYVNGDYRDQLPEATLNQTITEFETAINQFNNIVVLRRDNLPALASQKPELENNIRRQYQVLYDLFLRDYRGWQIENEGSTFTKRLEEATTRAEANLAAKAKQAEAGLTASARRGEEEIEKKGAAEVVNIVGTRSTQDWADEYKQYIEEDPAPKRNLANYRKTCIKYLDDNRGKKNYPKRIWMRIKRRSMLLKLYSQTTLFYNGVSYQNLSRRWRAWRSLAYLLLLLVTLFYLIHVLTVGVPSKNELFSYLIQKIAFIPLIAVIAIGMTFSGRNYRINSKLLEEYKHRYAVAKTIQNILLLPDMAQSTGFKNSLLQAGAQVLFEHRATGYIDKDGEAEIFEKLLSNSNLSLG